MKRIIVFLFAACLCVSNLYALFTVETYSFECVTNSIAGNAEIGESQLSMEVASTATGASFTFYNTGDSSCAITQVYFFDGVLLGLASDSINGSGGVSFVEEAIDRGNVHLPGYDEEPLNIYGALDRTSAGGVDNGVDPGEWLTVEWSLKPGKSFADLINGLDDGTVVVGMHVQGFYSTVSESFVAVPEPATLVILGLGSLTLLRRRRA